MIYPKNFEQKIGFPEVRELLSERCLSPWARQMVQEMSFATDAMLINQWQRELAEMRRIEEGDDDFPLAYYTDIRDAVRRARIENTHLEEDELFNLARTLQTVAQLVEFLYRQEDEEAAEGHEHWLYPQLHELADGIATFPTLAQQIWQIIDKEGHLRDNASQDLLRLRREIARTEGSISHILTDMLHRAQQDGLVEKDVTPTLRDGRLMIPVAPSLKRRIPGIVYDESASGRTVFIEPNVVVEANNKIRELKNDERQEVIRILTEFTKKVRPYTREIVDSLHFLAQVDFIHAKASVARSYKAETVSVADHPVVDWVQARHPLLERQIERKGGEQKLVPLDMRLTPEQHILIISGPNAGGKSVCLKTVALLQYMLQCGLAIPVRENSHCGIFQDLMMDIGDEQSIENDLSTYSGHLLNMKMMMRQASPRTLVLIDEFGSGTEPQIGGAIAESVLGQLLSKGAWGVITTHYQNLKHFADSHDGVVNGAMLYDRHEMQPLFQLSIGRPGSSFAIEIARKTGLPEEVIKEASEIVGSDYIQSDKYLQDIVRDKRYYEAKRQQIHQKEKELERARERYEEQVKDLDRQRREIMAKAKAEAQELLSQSNKQIENTIREIRESQAEKESTKQVRAQLKAYEDALREDQPTKSDDIDRRMEQIRQRRERREKRKAEKKAEGGLRKAEGEKRKAEEPIKEGDRVRMKGLESVGTVESLQGQMATVAFGDMHTKVRVSRLEHTPAEQSNTGTKAERLAGDLQAVRMSHVTQQTIDEHRQNFSQDLDVRGMRGDEALNAVQYFIDDAILAGMSRVRILHGKGNGILRQLIRQYLGTVPNVTHFADEHVQFGGAGITVVDL